MSLMTGSARQLPGVRGVVRPVLRPGRGRRRGGDAPGGRRRAVSRRAARTARGRAASGRRPSSGTRSTSVASGTSSQTERPSRLISCAVLGVGERAAAGGDDGVAERQKIEQHLALDAAEVRLALAREDRRRWCGPRAPRCARRCLPRASRGARRARAPSVDLPAPMNPPDRPCQSSRTSAASVSKNPDTRRPPLRRRRTVVGPEAASAGNGKRHREPMIADGVGSAAGQPASGRARESRRRNPRSRRPSPESPRPAPRFDRSP